MLTVAYIPKLIGLPLERQGKWFLHPDLRLRCRAEFSYLTDGERLWWYTSWPAPFSEIRSGFKSYAGSQIVKWLTPAPPGWKVSQLGGTSWSRQFD